MLAARIYVLMWLLMAAGGVLLYFTDSFNPPASLIFGFIIALLGGAGLLVVFPAVMAERHSPVRKTRKPIKLENLGQTANIS